MKAASGAPSTLIPKLIGAASRIGPARSKRSPCAASVAAVAAATIARASSSSPAPAVDTVTDRELRWSKVIPSDASSRLTAFDTLAFDRPSALAAAVKPPLSATATKQAQPS
jgi:hypothetical protein